MAGRGLTIGEHSGMRTIFVAFTLSLLLTALLRVPYVQAMGQDGFSCPDFPSPAVSLSFGSRYKDGSASRSDKDLASDREVTNALKPSDTFVRQLSTLSKVVRKKPEHSAVALDCMIDAINIWAEADAFSDMQSVGAKISYPSRVGGIAIAYAQVRHMLADRHSASEVRIDAWFRKRAIAIIDYWEGDAPRLAKKANLRAWAALAIVQIGQILDEPSYLEWGIASQKTILDTQSPDGSLPLEMRRGKYALHYQIHALAPMVLTRSLLRQTGKDLPFSYLERLKMAVDFTLKAIDDPSIVEAITQKKQTIPPGLTEQDQHMIAWLEIYLSQFPDPALSARLDGVRPLSNSKLGGDLTDEYEIW